MSAPNRAQSHADERDRILADFLEDAKNGQLSRGERLQLAQILTLRCIEDSIDALER